MPGVMIKLSHYKGYQIFRIINLSKKRINFTIHISKRFME